VKKTHYLQFQTKNSQEPDLDITLADKHINTSIRDLNDLEIVTYKLNLNN
jgi:hypothetical protein